MSTAIVKLTPPEPGFEETSEMPPPPPSGGPAGRGRRAGGRGGTPQAAPAAPSFPRPVIEVGVDEYRVVDDAVVALAGHKDVYVRGGMLVRIVSEQPLPSSVRGGGAPRIAPISYYALRDLLTASADWVRYSTDKDGNEIEHLVHPPEWAVGEVDARGE